MKIVEKDINLAELMESVCYSIYGHKMANHKQIPATPLNKCQAKIITLLCEDNFTLYVLQSYKTLVACIYEQHGVHICVSFARIAYGEQTRTMTQHIYKFMKWCKADHYYHD